MALDDSALLEMIDMLRSADGGELMRRLLGGMLQAVVDAEATAHIGAGPHQRSDARTTQRNGSRDKTITTTAGDLTVKIPKVRTGSFFPALLAPRRRIDVALHAVVMQAYVEGVSTRRVDDLVVALGGTGISKSEVSRICAQLDRDVAAWRARSLDEQAFPYVFCDATYCKVRLGWPGRLAGRRHRHRRVRRRPPGGAGLRGRRQRDRELLDRVPALATRPGPVRRAAGHQRQPPRLTGAIATVLQGAAWQRCRVHFMRNALAKVSKGHAEMVAATIRTIFAQPTGDQAREHVDVVADMLATQFPAVARCCWTPRPT
jgi:putative transposase